MRIFILQVIRTKRASKMTSKLNKTHDIFSSLGVEPTKFLDVSITKYFPNRQVGVLKTYSPQNPFINHTHRVNFLSRTLAKISIKKLSKGMINGVLFEVKFAKIFKGLPKNAYLLLRNLKIDHSYTVMLNKDHTLLNKH